MRYLIASVACQRATAMAVAQTGPRKTLFAEMALDGCTYTYLQTRS
jgi:hypothetical protein